MPTSSHVIKENGVGNGKETTAATDGAATHADADK